MKDTLGFYEKYFPSSTCIYASISVPDFICSFIENIIITLCNDVKQC